MAQFYRQPSPLAGVLTAAKDLEERKKARKQQADQANIQNAIGMVRTGGDLTLGGIGAYQRGQERKQSASQFEQELGERRRQFDHPEVSELRKAQAQNYREGNKVDVTMDLAKQVAAENFPLFSDMTEAERAQAMNELNAGKFDLLQQVSRRGDLFEERAGMLGPDIDVTALRGGLSRVDPRQAAILWGRMSQNLGPEERKLLAQEMTRLRPFQKKPWEVEDFRPLDPNRAPGWLSPSALEMENQLRSAAQRAFDELYGFSTGAPITEPLLSPQQYGTLQGADIEDALQMFRNQGRLQPR